MESECIESGLNAGLGRGFGTQYLKFFTGAQGCFSRPVLGGGTIFNWGLVSVDTPILLVPYTPSLTLTRWQFDELARSNPGLIVRIGDVPF